MMTQDGTAAAVKASDDAGKVEPPYMEIVIIFFDGGVTVRELIRFQR